MLRSLGPIGHCSAKLRRAMEIEEEAALAFRVRVKDSSKVNARSSSGRGNRWKQPARFSIPGPYHERPVSSTGKVAFHFALDTLSKTCNGGCQIMTVKGSKRLTVTAPADHDRYIDRPGAVPTIDPADYDRYAARAGAVEQLGVGSRALRTNISYDDAVRARYWRAVHDHERTPKPDRLRLDRDALSKAKWQQVSELASVPDEVRQVAAAFATGAVKQKSRFLKMDLAESERTIAAISVALGTPKDKQVPASIIKGRGGRSQFRLTAEFPEGLDAVGRLAITDAFCADLASFGFMYVAAIHAPDHHNDNRNFHLHIAFHDRPAKLISDRWDFEIAVPVAGQHNRFNYPYRQKKIAGFSRDPDGRGHRQYGATIIAEFRRVFAELCNEQLEVRGVMRRFDPGSFATMGIERKPTRPLGTRAAPLEAAGVATSTGIGNAEIIWSAVLQDLKQEAERQAKVRQDLLRRFKDARIALAARSGAAAAALAARLQEGAARFIASLDVLDRHALELAEYDATRLMTVARPAKAADSARRILDAIADGSASASDRRAQASIETRLFEARTFLREIGQIEASYRPVIDQHRSELQSASAVVAKVAGLLDKDLLELPATEAAVTFSADTPRDVIDGLMNRILAKDIPILLPDGSDGPYRVPGISKAEFRALTAPALSDMAQRRLSELADIQAKRMQEAAIQVGRHGLPGLDARAADGDRAAGRTARHARAYADHPVYIRYLSQPARAPRIPTPRPAVALGEARRAKKDPQPGFIASLRKYFGGPARKAPQPSRQPDPPQGEDRAPPVPQVPASSGRDEAIQRLATAVISEPALRVIENAAGLALDSRRVPELFYLAEAFSDETVVQEAIARRRASPWLDFTPFEREGILATVQAVLMNSDPRTAARAVGGRERCGDAGTVTDVISAWRGYDPVKRMLTEADRAWTQQIDQATNTALRMQRQIPAKPPKQEQKTVGRDSAEPAPPFLNWEGPTPAIPSGADLERQRDWFDARSEPQR